MAVKLRDYYRLNYLTIGKSTIRKGAFPAIFGLIKQDDNTTIERLKKPLSRRGRGSRYQEGNKRKRAETKINPDLEGSTCRACFRFYSLKECFYIIPGKAPKGWRSNANVKRLVKERLKQDNSLEEEIKRLTKDITTDGND